MNTDDCHFKAGAASVCFTSEESLWLAGYAARTAPARGTISDLYATSVVLEDHRGEKLVIASADVIAITRPIVDAVAEHARVHYGLARRQLILAATHTHYAPEFRPDKEVFFKVPAEYVAKLPNTAERLISALNQAIDEAVTKLEPVRLFTRRWSAKFGHNRRR